MKNRKAIPLIVYLLLLFAVFSWANNLFSDNLSQIPYSQVVELFRQEQVKAFEIQDDVITMELHGTLNGENIIKASLAYPEHFLTEMGGLLQEQKASGVLEYYSLSPAESFSPYDLILPLILAGLVVVLTGLLVILAALAGLIVVLTGQLLALLGSSCLGGCLLSGSFFSCFCHA